MEKKFERALGSYLDTALRFERYLESNRRIAAILADVNAVLCKKLGYSTIVYMLNQKTGEFKDGGYAPYFEHPELATYYAELIHHVEMQRESGWQTSDDGEAELEEKKAVLYAARDALKRLAGGDRAINRIKDSLWSVDTAALISEVL
jgi:hypothetical protein